MIVCKHIPRPRVHCGFHDQRRVERAFQGQAPAQAKAQRCGKLMAVVEKVELSNTAAVPAQALEDLSLDLIYRP